MLENIRNEVIQQTEKIASKATNAELFFVVCFWQSPLSKRVEHRVGYFEDLNETFTFYESLEARYKEYNVPFYIVSNGCSDFNCGLL